MDAKLAQFGVDLQLADGIHRRQVGLAGWVPGNRGFVVEASDPFCDPAPQGGGVSLRARGVAQVPGRALARYAEAIEREVVRSGSDRRPPAAR